MTRVFSRTLQVQALANMPQALCMSKVLLNAAVLSSTVLSIAIRLVILIGFCYPLTKIVNAFFFNSEASLYGWLSGEVV